MCLNENTLKISNIILLYGPIILSIIYLLILYLKRIKKKKIILNIIICLIFIAIINVVRITSFKICENENKNNITTSTTTKEVITTETTTKLTTTTSTTTTTEKKETTTTKTTKTTTAKAQKNVPSSSKGYKVTYKNGAYYVDNHLIVNKTYPLSSDFIPTNTHKTITKSMDGFCRECIDNEAYKAWQQMKSDAASINLNLWIQSGYRSYYYQKDLYDGYVKRKGKSAADKSSARPGHSEHQSGLAFDLNTITTSFKDTAEGKWVNNNCYLYGYIIRFPEGKTNETGYIFEPWHIRYVGKDLAKKLYNNGNWITMEAYFGLTSEYQN